MMSAASFSALAAFCSPSAAITWMGKESILKARVPLRIYISPVRSIPSAGISNYTNQFIRALRYIYSQ